MVEDISGVSRAGEVKVPLQLYLPWCNVFSGLKCRVVVALFMLLETLILSLLEIISPQVDQIAIGELIRPSTAFNTVQVRLYIKPALAMPELLTLTVMASRGTKKYRYYHSAIKSLTSNYHQLSQ